MSFDKAKQLLDTVYNQHGLDNPILHQQRDIFRKAYRDITDVNNNFAGCSFGSPKHILDKELGRLCYNYLENSYSDNLVAFTKKVEYLESMLKSFLKASILVEDYSSTWGSKSLIGIEKSLLHHNESSCRSFLSFFYVGPEEQLYNDISKAADCFNKASNYKEIGSENNTKLHNL